MGQGARRASKGCGAGEALLNSALTLHQVVGGRAVPLEKQGRRAGEGWRKWATQKWGFEGSAAPQVKQERGAGEATLRAGLSQGFQGDAAQPVKQGREAGEGWCRWPTQKGGFEGSVAPQVMQEREADEVWV